MNPRGRKPFERHYDQTLEFAWVVHNLRPSQRADLLAKMHAVIGQHHTDPAARRVIWVEDARGHRRPYTPADDRDD